MKNRWTMPHPATMFFLLTLLVVFLSWISDIYGLSVVHPQTGEAIRVQGLLSPEGLRWRLRHVVTNFTGFAPLGMVLVAMFGIGVAQHSGFIDACIRWGVKRGNAPWRIVLGVGLMGLLSNVAGDAGYIFLLPIAATLFLSAGLHPIAGIITAYVSVSCGYSANVLLSTLDPMLSMLTQEAANRAGIDSIQAGPLGNYYFLFVSTFLLTGIIYVITRRRLLPSLGTYRGVVRFQGYKGLSRKERRALLTTGFIGLCYALLMLFATFSSWGILRSVDGGLIRSPFIEGILFLLSLGLGLMGMIYGFISGRYRSDADVIEGLAYPIRLMGIYFVITFFASQMFACLSYSQLDRCLAIMGADLLSSVHVGKLGLLVLFVLFTAVINLFMVSATAKWAFMAFIFVPVLGDYGIAPEVTQCAFRIGDSATNAITPFMFYMPLVLAYMQQYEPTSNYGSLLRHTLCYSLSVLLAWTLLLLLWQSMGWSLGM